MEAGLAIACFGQRNGMRVVVTGASGYLGRMAIPMLLQRDEVHEVLGLDRAPPPAQAQAWASKYRHEVIDLGKEDTAAWMQRLEGVGALLHLAFDLAPPPGQAHHASNWEGQNALMLAAMAHPRRVMLVSAIAAYGFGHAIDLAHGSLDESAERRGGTGVAYAQAKQDLEALLDRLEQESPAQLLRLRPTNVVGPHADPKRAKILMDATLWVPRVKHPLRQQFLHEEDWARAVDALWTAPAGAYNVGPDDWVLVEEVAKLLGQRLIQMPPWALRPLAEAAYRTGLSAYPSDWLAFMEQPPIIVSNHKLRALGWTPRFGSKETLMLALGALKAQSH